MSSLLKIIGFLTAIITACFGIVAAVDSGSSWIFIACLISGILEAVIYFAIAMILDNQEIMLSRLLHIEAQLEGPKKENKEKIEIEKKRKCACCGRSYEIDRNSCPYCGYRG